jgi:ribosomal protein S18 acetylase RimI-like enzyme
VTGSVEIRDAREADAPAIARLLGELGYPSTVEDVRERLHRFTDNARDRAVVADRGGTVIGVLSVSIAPRLAEGGHYARITALAVASDARRQGVGRALVSRSEEIACEAGCAVIEVSSGRRPERDPAHLFYPGLGYHDAATHHVLYTKPLEGAQATQ